MAQEYGKRVWAGDPSIVAEARAKYKADEGQLIPFAVALYSFRSNKKFADELLGLRHKITDYASEYIQFPRVFRHTERQRADMADVLSTHLEWMSRQEGVPPQERLGLRKNARVVANFGISVIGEEGYNGNHTYCLLQLTRARLSLAELFTVQVAQQLELVSLYCSAIQDSNQRARVYRKLGFLFHKSGNYTRGLYWGIRACFVRGVPIAVHAKSLVALLGIDL